MDIKTPEQLFDYIKSNSLEKIIENSQKYFNYEKNYQKYKEVRLKELVKNKQITLYIWYRYLSSNKLLSKIIMSLFPNRFPKGYFDLRPFEYVFKHLPPAPYNDRGDSPTFEDAIVEIKNNIDDYHYVYNKLDDELSRKTLFTIMLARLTHDPSLFIANNVWVKFEPCFDKSVYNLPKEAVYVDCGGFNGDTVLKFIKIFGNYKQIYVFEPDQIARKDLNKNLKHVNNLIIKNKGVSDKKTTIAFKHQGGGVGRVSYTNTLDTNIDLVTLDEEIGEKIDLVKMDIEGAEVSALEGMREHIKNDSPIMAINVYHKLSDIRECFHAIEKNNTDYKFVLRHYWYHYVKTVLYAVPKND